MKNHEASSRLTWISLTCNKIHIFCTCSQQDGWIATRRGAGLASRLLNFMEDKAWASPGELGLLGIAVF